MTFDIVRPDEQGRISLAAYNVKPGQTFEVEALSGGRIRLIPVKHYHEQFADLPEGQKFRLPGAENSGSLYIKTGDNKAVRVFGNRADQTRYYSDLKQAYPHWNVCIDALILED